MIRDSMGNAEYWEKWANFTEESIRKDYEQIQKPSKNPIYRPQFVWDLSIKNLRLTFKRYSRGDSVLKLAGPLPALIDAWELSNRLADELNAQLKTGQGWNRRHLLTAPMASDDPRSHTDPRAWTFKLSNLNHYNWCFWLVGLALALDIPEDQWQRLLKLIDGAGEDVLLDRVIASRQSDRPTGSRLLHPKPYSRLLKAIDAPREQQAVLLREFVDHWYAELARKGNDELWWYVYGDPVKHPLEKGSYFGRWCLEAVAAVKAFSLDDSQCLGHEHYPGDFLRPNGPSTHPVRPEPKRGWLSKLLGR